MNDEMKNSSTPQQMREALAAKIPEVFASRKKPAWARSRKRGDTLLRNWAKKYGPSFSELVKPIVYHKDRDDIPFDVLGHVEASEPGFWWRWPDNRDAYYYLLPAYLRGMLLGPNEIDVGFDFWLDHLLPFTYDEIRSSGQLRIVDEQVLHERLTSRSKRLDRFTPEERVIIAEFFRNFAAMFPGYLLSEHKDTLAFAENFWDGVYWQRDTMEDEE